jgi:hypothetical protein
LAVAVLASTTATGCSQHATNDQASTGTPTRLTPPKETDCRPLPAGPGPAEVQGVIASGSLWILILGDEPVRKLQETKIVWRMTGQGPLNVEAIDSHGREATLTAGPDAHGASSWNRPGDEWGTGIIFPEAGCWRLHGRRTTGSGDIHLSVAS